MENYMNKDKMYELVAKNILKLGNLKSSNFQYYCQIQLLLAEVLMSCGKYYYMKRLNM